MTAVAEALAVWAPDAASELAAAEALAARTPVGRPAILARLRIASLLGGPAALERHADAALRGGIDDGTVAALPRWPTSERFDETDRACLALAEQFVIDVSAVTDADVEAVLTHLGPAGLYGFVQCLWVTDMTERLHIGLGAVLASEPDGGQG